LWYTPFSTLLEFFTSLIIHSPLCSPAWFLRCTSSIAIFSLQTVNTHCVSQNSFFSITFFSSSFSPWNHFKSQVSSPRWWWRLQALHFPYPFYLTHSTSSSTQIQERLERWFHNIIVGFAWEETFLSITWTAWHNSDGRKFNKEAFLSILLCIWAQVQSQSTPDMENIMKNINFFASCVLWTELEPKYRKRWMEIPFILWKFLAIVVVSNCTCYWQKNSE
jgi:hypothetical protein